MNKIIFGLLALVLTAAFLMFLPGAIEYSYRQGTGSRFEIESQKKGGVTQQGREKAIQIGMFTAFFSGMFSLSIYGLLLLLLSYTCKIKFMTTKKISITAVILILFGGMSMGVSQALINNSKETAIYGSAGIGVMVALSFGILFTLIWCTKKIISKIGTS